MDKEIDELIKVIEIVQNNGGKATIIDGTTGEEVSIDKLRARLAQLNKELDNRDTTFSEAIKAKAEGPTRAMEVDRVLVADLLRKYKYDAKKVLLVYSTIEREGLKSLLIGSGIDPHTANIISFASMLGFVQNLITNVNVADQYDEIIETFEEVIKKYKRI